MLLILKILIRLKSSNLFAKDIEYTQIKPLNLINYLWHQMFYKKTGYKGYT